jgi:DNA-binding NarL/FixJ family response regulator
MTAQDAKLRVLIADDSQVTRFGIRTVLERAGLEVCGEAADGAAAIELAVAEHPDVCLLDVNMPNGGGIFAVREIIQQVPGAQILMLTSSDAGEDVYSALQHGATGYVLKDEAMDEITDAVRAAAAGEGVMSKRIVRGLMSETAVRERRAGAAGGRGELLTDGEWDVLELLALGRSEHDVALRVGIEEDKVDRVAEMGRRKLGCEDRHAAYEVIRRIRGI